MDISRAGETAAQIVHKTLHGVPDLAQMTQYLAATTGKGVRTTVLLSAAADENSRVPADAPMAAAAIEMLHMASLVHDDIIDDASMRRGVASLHRAFDTKSAVLCGDYLISLALGMFAQCDAARLDAGSEYKPFLPRMAYVLGKICRGEYLQHTQQGNFQMSLMSYLRIIGGKTAALFSAAAGLGSFLAGDDARTIARLGRFGRSIGMAFQIYDDCKDYEANADEAKKPVAHDAKSGVCTLPLIFAVRKHPGLLGLARDVFAGTADAQALAAQVRDASGTAAAKQAADRFCDMATRAIAPLAPNRQAALAGIIARLQAGWRT